MSDDIFSKRGWNLKLFEEKLYNDRADKTTGGSGLPRKCFCTITGSLKRSKMALPIKKMLNYFISRLIAHSFPLGFVCVEENLPRKIFFLRSDFFLFRCIEALAELRHVKWFHSRALNRWQNTNLLKYLVANATLFYFYFTVVWRLACFRSFIDVIVVRVKSVEDLSHSPQWDRQCGHQSTAQWGDLHG